MDVALSSLSVEAVCDILTKIDGINISKLDQYCNTLHNSNINGMVLATCDLLELKAEMNMNFGDWELFRSAIQVMREREMARRQQGLGTPDDFDGRQEVQSPRVDFIQDNRANRSPANLRMPIPKYPDQGRQSATYKRNMERLESVDEVETPRVQHNTFAKRHSVTPPGESKYRYSPAQGEHSRGLPTSPTSPTQKSMVKRDSVVGEILFENELLYRRMEHLGIENEAQDDDVFEDTAQRGVIYRNAPDQIQLSRPPSRRASVEVTSSHQGHRRKTTVSPQKVTYVTGEDYVAIMDPYKKERGSPTAVNETSQLERSISSYTDCDEAPLLNAKKSLLPKSLTKSLEKLSKATKDEGKVRPGKTSSKETLSHQASKDLTSSQEQMLSSSSKEKNQDGKVTRKSGKTVSINEGGKPSASYERLALESSSLDSLPSQVGNNSVQTSDKAALPEHLLPSFNVVRGKNSDTDVCPIGSVKDAENGDLRRSNVSSAQSSYRGSYNETYKLSVKDELKMTEHHHKEALPAGELQEAISRAQKKMVSSADRPARDEGTQHVSAFTVVTSSHTTSECSSISSSRQASIENVSHSRSSFHEVSPTGSKGSPRKFTPTPPNIGSPSGPTKPEVILPMQPIAVKKESPKRDVEYTGRVETGLVKDFANEDVVQI